MSDTASTHLARSNIQAALALRGKSSFEVSTALGRNRTYIDDFLKNRKDSLSIVFTSKLAEFLDVHSSYLHGERQWEGSDIVPARGKKATLINLEIDTENMERAVAKLEDSKAAGAPVDDKLLDAIDNLERQRELANLIKSQLDPEDKMFGGDGSKARQPWVIPQDYAEDTLGTKSHNLHVFTINDMAMNGADRNGLIVGDRVFVDVSKREPDFGGIFALKIKDGVIFRSIAPPSDGRRNIFTCVAMNPLYPAFEITKAASAKIVGRVVACIRRI